MTDQIDCQWIEENLEPLFCDRLDPEQTRRARAHIDDCDSCRREVQALNAIDPLVQKHFQRELEIAQQPRALHTGRVFGLSTAALALVAILAFVALRPSPTTSQAVALSPAPPQATVTAEVQPPPPAAKDVDPAGSVQRTKPAHDRVKTDNRVPQAQSAKSDNAPDFLVMDAAGYSHRIEDYRGHVVIVAVWSGASQQATANFQRLYETHGSDTKFRFAGVSNERLAKPQSVTFPIFYNRGSKLFNAKSGEFVLLDENGGIVLRGSLVKDFDNLQKTLEGN